MEEDEFLNSLFGNQSGGRLDLAQPTDLTSIGAPTAGSPTDALNRSDESVLESARSVLDIVDQRAAAGESNLLPTVGITDGLFYETDPDERGGIGEKLYGAYDIFVNNGDGLRARAGIDQLGDATRLEAYQNALAGSGQITEAESRFGQAAFNKLGSTGQKGDEAEYIRNLRELYNVARIGRIRQLQEIQTQNTSDRGIVEIDPNTGGRTITYIDPNSDRAVTVDGIDPNAFYISNSIPLEMQQTLRERRKSGETVYYHNERGELRVVTIP